MADLILSTQDGAVLVLTLNAAERRNTFSLEMRDELHAALRDAARNPEVRSIVITGAGGTFSAGGDMRPGGAWAAMVGAIGSRMRLEAFNDIIRLVAAGPKPVIAAVERFAFGAGLSLALACDYLVAADNAQFCAAFIRVGLMPDCGLVWTLPQRVGMGAARKMMLTGRIVEAAEALDMRLVDEVVATDQTLSVAIGHARQFAEAPTVAVAALKSTLARGPGSLQEALDRDVDLQAMLSGTADHAEGKAAFVEKRKSRFTGR